MTRRRGARRSRWRGAVPALLLALAAAVPAAAHEEKVGDITLRHPWSRPAPEGRNGVVYVRILNEGAGADRLIAARTPVARQVELHRSTLTDGVHRMAKVDGIAIPAGGAAALEPGGLHLMLRALKTTLMAEETHPIVFVFERTGEVATTFSVEAGHDGHRLRDP